MNNPQTAQQINAPQVGMTDAELIQQRQCPECERLMRCAEAQQIQIQRLLIERNQAQAACAEMREWIEDTVANCSVFRDAPGLNCGKGWVRVGEIENTKNFLKWLVELLRNASDGHKSNCICWTCTALRDSNREFSRLEKLIQHNDC